MEATREWDARIAEQLGLEILDGWYVKHEAGALVYYGRAVPTIDEPDVWSPTTRIQDAMWLWDDIWDSGVEWMGLDQTGKDQFECTVCGLWDEWTISSGVQHTRELAICETWRKRKGGEE